MNGLDCAFSYELHNKTAGRSQLSCVTALVTLFGRLDVRGGRAFLSLRHVEGDLLAVLERLVARALDRAVVREQILAAVIRRDEAEALRVVEPLHGACWHINQSSVMCEANRASLAGTMFKGSTGT